MVPIDLETGEGINVQALFALLGHAERETTVGKGVCGPREDRLDGAQLIHIEPREHVTDDRLQRASERPRRADTLCSCIGEGTTACVTFDRLGLKSSSLCASRILNLSHSRQSNRLAKSHP